MELSKTFCLHTEYHSKSNIFFQDTKEKTDEYQDKVYELFRKVVNECEISNPTISLLRKKYPNKTWVTSNFESIPFKTDLLICADVIEHVMNPDELMSYIMKMNPEHLVISTPDRDLLVQLIQRDNNGPPKNPYHVREWSFGEFAEYISQFFDIIEHINDPSEYNQYIHCKKKS